MLRIMHVILLTAGILFIGSLVKHWFPIMSNTAFSAGTFPVTYWLLFLMAMGVIAYMAIRKKGRR